MKAKAVAITQSLVTDENGNALTPDQHIVYTARVSNPSNQQNHATGPKLLEFCMLHGHWSVFEQADLTIEVETSRAIAAQILRHKSFSFQEFSQRYSDVSKLGDVMVEELEMRAKHVSGLKGVQPPLPFGERTRDCSPGHAVRGRSPPV